MAIPDQTSWTLIGRAAQGNALARNDFTEQFAPIVRRQLARRWRGTPVLEDLDDATQEVLLACFQDGGALENACAEAPLSFRGYLFGVVRNIARHFEAERIRRGASVDGFTLDGIRSGATTMGRFQDRATARDLLCRATARHLAQAQTEGDGAMRRFELLQLRFEDGLAIREIAEQWDEDPAKVHQQYRRARREFRRSLDAELAAEGRDPEQAWHDLVAVLRR